MFTVKYRLPRQSLQVQKIVCAGTQGINDHQVNPVLLHLGLEGLDVRDYLSLKAPCTSLVKKPALRNNMRGVYGDPSQPRRDNEGHPRLRRSASANDA
jgi:hypothetical protein